MKGEDPSRPEGVVQFVVTDLASLESQLSDPVMIRNVPWYVGAFSLALNIQCYL